ncbi:MAG: Na+/H+ antiporter [Parachlamydiaceae bacterium]|nr:Na+/H+ antiporter [Parachlamydiaceae bacterium]
MENIEIIFFLLLSAVLLVGFAQRIHVSYPIILVLGGAAISFIPGIDNIYFDPNLVLMIFLPPVLYYSAFGISFREFQRNWKNIFSLALGLVAFTTVVVAIIFKWMFPEFSWSFAFAFGAIVSPPDAIAVTSILKRFNINSRLITLLEGESLINDASAIVIYKISMIALMTGTSSFSEGSRQFFYTGIGGIAVGSLLGFLFQGFSDRFLEPVLGVVFSFTIPYVTYIIADMLHVSGVLAVVVNGLIGARVLRTHHSPQRRVLGHAIWDIFILLLNCLVFILIGLQIKTISAAMSNQKIILYSGYAFLIAFTMLIVRMIWVYTRAAFSYFKALKHRDASKRHSQILKEAAIVGWAGMRGIVSLAVALALPFTLPDGIPLEGRNEVVFITFMVILITLLIPGITLPMLIRWLNLKYPDQNNDVKNVRNLLAQHAEENVDSLFESKIIEKEEYDFLKKYFDSHHKALELAHGAEHNLTNIELARRKVLHFQRVKLLEMWKMDEIDDKLLNHLENELDMLETHTIRAELKL